MEISIQYQNDKRAKLYLIEGGKLKKEAKKKKLLKFLYKLILYIIFVSIVSFVVYRYIQLVRPS
ncbi:MAG: hypothetical protein NZ853_09855 [Leptospiraceae bacterium]|nr:hypothetical protein [Leptospiraceae bacterium]MDW7976999.1 hypothetical protein [Leptospiraceae bacterium]